LEHLEWNCLHTAVKEQYLYIYMNHCIPGSGALAAPDAHIFWFGHPWHDEDLPACSLFVPGQSRQNDNRL